MKTLRVLPVVLIGVVILGSVGCRNYDFTESLEDDFEITGTSTEESIGTLTSEEEELVITAESTIGNAKDVTTVTDTSVVAQDEESTSADDQRQEHDNSANEDNNSTVSEPTSTPVPQSTEATVVISTPIPVSATSTPKPTAIPEPMESPTPKPTNTPVPTATPTPEPTEAPEPTPRPAVAAYVQATFIVYGGTDDENPTYVESTVVRTYQVQPKDGCSYHSHQVSDYVCIDNQISWTDLDNAFLQEHPGCVVHGYDTVGEQVIGFVDD